MKITLKGILILIFLLSSSTSFSEEGHFSKATKAQDNARECAGAYATEFEKAATITELQDGALYSCDPLIESYATNIDLFLTFSAGMNYTQEYKDTYTMKYREKLKNELRLIVADTAIRKRSARTKR